MSFLVREDSFWSVVLPPDESAMVTRHIRAHHVDLQLNTEVTDLHDDGNGRVGGVTTNAGTRLDAQFVGVSIGVSANVGWLRNGPLDVERGILVDETLQTNIPASMLSATVCSTVTRPAAPTGPCANPPNKSGIRGRIMGETLAKTLLGKLTPDNPGVFFNSAKFFDIEYQTYGDVPATLPDDGSLKTFYWEHPNGEIGMRITTAPTAEPSRV